MKRIWQHVSNSMDFKSFYNEGVGHMKPRLFTYVTSEIFKDPDFADDGQVRVEDFLEAHDLYSVYPWMRHKVMVELVHSNHRVLNGEGIKIVTLGAGEGVIYIARDYWDEALDVQGENQLREFLAKAVIHELGHALNDHDDPDYGYSSSDEIDAAEKFANDFMNKWYR